MKILNFGSLNLDHIYHVPHLVRPQETVLGDDLELVSGGKGLNQSVALALAGLNVYHAGAIGKDGSIDPSRLEQVSVTLGENDDSYIEITGGELQEGDTIVIEQTYSSIWDMMGMSATVG